MLPLSLGLFPLMLGNELMDFVSTSLSLLLLLFHCFCFCFLLLLLRVFVKALVFAASLASSIILLLPMSLHLGALLPLFQWGRTAEMLFLAVLM